ncbi:MAG: hypothetical protein OEW05_09730 [Candidatus Aminicenantes bacterium]|nr:hypothetical protein [Candidatus Aminicenantes bacterium]
MRDEYLARINRVMDHVEQNLDRPLRLDALARVAYISKRRVDPAEFFRAGGCINP